MNPVLRPHPRRADGNDREMKIIHIHDSVILAEGEYRNKPENDGEENDQGLHSSSTIGLKY